MRKSKTSPLLLALVMAVCANTAVFPAAAFSAEAETVTENETESPAESTEEQKTPVQDERENDKEPETAAAAEEAKTTPPLTISMESASMI